jgi:5'(3')-deoxyribonucleotidase
VKPVILLDIDGVAANFIEGCKVPVKKITGRDFHHDDIDQFMIERALNLDEEQTKQLYDHVMAPGWCRSLPVYEGAKESVAELQTFAEVVPVTSHFWSSKHWVFERDEWILEHFGIHQKEVVHTHSKFRVDGDMLIDDKTSHLVAWKKKHPYGCAVRFLRAYNAKEDWRKPDGTSEFPNSDWGVVALDWPHLARFAKMHFGVEGGSSR